MNYSGEYDDLLRQAWTAFMGGLPFDPGWHLARAQMIAESGGNPAARSEAGALGLFQLMPETGVQLGVTDRLAPSQSIRAGIQYDRQLYDVFRKETGWDRWKFALASYNAGEGHILHAQSRAQQGGLDPSKWESIVETLPAITAERSAETINYVARIVALYNSFTTLSG